MQKQAEAAQPGSGIAPTGFVVVQAPAPPAHCQVYRRFTSGKNWETLVAFGPMAAQRSSAVLISVELGREIQFVPIAPAPVATRVMSCGSGTARVEVVPRPTHTRR